MTDQEKAIELAKEAGMAVGPLKTIAAGTIEEVARLILLAKNEAFMEAAEECGKLAECEENTPEYRAGACFSAYKILSLSKEPK